MRVCYDHEPEQHEVAKEATRMAGSIIESLLSEQHRWRDVNFVWQCRGLSDSFRDIRAENMPLLRSLTLSFNLSKKSDGTLLTVPIDIAKSIDLRRIALDGNFLLTLDEDSVHTSMECGKLIFHQECVSELAGLMCLDLLKVAPNLKQLLVWFPDGIHVPFQSPDGELHDAIVHDLRSLSFNGYMMPFTTNRVSFRSLKAIHFTDGGRGDMLARFIDQHTPSLTFLQITERVDSDRLIEVLHVLPALQVLWIAHGVRSELMRLIDTLSISKNDGDSTNGSYRNANIGTICPYLHSLHFHFMATKDYYNYLESMCSMLESRCIVLDTLQRIRFRGQGKDGEVIEMPFAPEDHTEIARQISKCYYRHFYFGAEGDGVQPYPFDFLT